MLHRHLLAIALSFALPFLPAHGAEPDDATLRTDVEELVLRAWDPRYQRVEGDSPTLRMSRLIAAGDARVRPLLLEAWEITSKGHGEFAGARDCVLHLAVYLYGIDAAKYPGGYEWTERAGAVCLERREKFDGPGWYEMATNPPPLAETIGEAAMRAPPAPTAAGIFELLDTSEPATWTRDDAVHLAMALGEVSARDPTARTELLRRAGGAPDDLRLAIALGWEGSAESVALVEQRARGRSQADVPRCLTHPLGPATLFATLHHADPAALRDIVAPNGAFARERDLRLVGFEVAISILGDELGRAETDSARGDVLERLHGFIVDESSRPRWLRPMPARPAAELTRALAAALPKAEGAEREHLLEALRWMHYPWRQTETTYGSSHSFAPDRKEEVDLAVRAPYPDGVAVARALAADLHSGALTLRDGLPGLFEARPPADRRELRGGAAGVYRLEPPSDDACAPIRLTGKWTAAGLSLTLRNEGADPVALNPVALRYATTAACERRVIDPGELRTTTRWLDVTLGDLSSHATVPARLLRVLEPGKTFTWTLPVRDEDRELPHVAISMGFPSRRSMGVEGDPPAPLLEAFEQTWIF